MMLSKWERHEALEMMDTGGAIKSKSIRMHSSAQPASLVVALGSQLISTMFKLHFQFQLPASTYLVQLMLAGKIAAAYDSGSR